GIGVSSQQGLDEAGAIESYTRLKAQYGPAVTLNMLWGLYAAVNHVDPRELTPDIKTHLKSLLSVKR
ncbi:MAG: TfoX/Sxy family DNA transformation protein, partial [Asticcacaulis sp.]